MRTLENRKTVWTPWAAALLGGFLLAGTALAEPTGGYGYLRVIDGAPATLDSGGDHLEAALNQPLLRGDRLRVPERGRVETVLADGTLVRIDGGSEITFERLAASADGDDRASILSLAEGNLQLVVRDDSRALDFPRIDTGNSTIYIEGYGVYRIAADGADWSQLVVREGRARVVTDGDETEIRAGQSATIEGHERAAELGTDPAGALDPIERWGSRLDDEARLAENDELDTIEPDYRYEAASLGRYGSWLSIEGNRYWRPRVADDWRPYWRGSWVSTPSGLTWVSSEPWGWLPAHYGTWDYLPAYGWVWQPGYVYSPAWVYWYWGPSHVGWCPTGYYTRYYRASFGVHAGFRFGVYGWAGGDWGNYDRWNFAPIDRFGSRDLYRYTRRGRDFGRDGRHAVPRGIITTDTHGITRNDWNKPQRVAEILGRRGRDGNARPNGRDGMVRQVGDLPDVTSFVARKPLAPAELNRIVADKPDPRFDGTPLKPDSLGQLPGRGGRAGRAGTRDPLVPGVADGIRPGRGRETTDKPAFGEGVRPSVDGGGEGIRPRRGRSGEGIRPGVDGSGEGIRPADPLVTGPEARRDGFGGSRPTFRAPEAGDKPFASRRPARGEDGGTPRAGRDEATGNGDKPLRQPRGWREAPPSSSPPTQERPQTGETGSNWRNRPSPAPYGRRDDSAAAVPDRPSGRRYGADRSGEDKPAPTYSAPTYSRPSTPDRGYSRRDPVPSSPSPRPSYDPGSRPSRSEPPSVRPSSPPPSRGDEGKGRARDEGGSRGGGGDRSGGGSRSHGHDRKPPE